MSPREAPAHGSEVCLGDAFWRRSRATDALDVEPGPRRLGRGEEVCSSGLSTAATAHDGRLELAVRRLTVLKVPPATVRSVAATTVLRVVFKFRVA